MDFTGFSRDFPGFSKGLSKGLPQFSRDFLCFFFFFLRFSGAFPDLFAAVPFAMSFCERGSNLPLVGLIWFNNSPHLYKPFWLRKTNFQIPSSLQKPKSSKDCS